MKIDYAEARELLRRSRSGALGSWSVSERGYPFVTAVPYVPDERARPLFLMSGLAEHTRNLLADSRASLLVTEGEGGSFDQARLTLIGTVARVELDEASRARYLRYCPESVDYLSLGDFRFFRMEPEKVRFIGGFGRMGWIGATSPERFLDSWAEEALLQRLVRATPVSMTLLGIDFEGLDVRIGGIFRRFALSPPAGSADALHDAAAEVLLRADYGLPGGDSAAFV
ncbi:MAG TPA: pyridoxamine 5'-phosphate oxidase family protein [Zoogloea sp.]|nr:pyridoxamine 5'-phosphate oxidase family protein [Zoogloea sp.]